VRARYCSVTIGSCPSEPTEKIMNRRRVELSKRSAKSMLVTSSARLKMSSDEDCELEMVCVAEADVDCDGDKVSDCDTDIDGEDDSEADADKLSDADSDSDADCVNVDEADSDCE
jgi:hypothetical protein